MCLPCVVASVAGIQQFQFVLLVLGRPFRLCVNKESINFRLCVNKESFNQSLSGAGVREVNKSEGKGVGRSTVAFRGHLLLQALVDNMFDHAARPTTYRKLLG